MRWSILGAAAAVLVSSGLVWASPFEWAPEDHQPWSSGFPYQRNVDLTFDVSPVGAPGTGIPGAHYEGTADPWLSASDFVTFGGAFQWYSSVSGLPLTGLVGIDNRGGSAPRNGQIVIHLDNIPTLAGQKRIWIEWDYVSSVENMPSSFYVSDSLGHLPSQQWASQPRQVGNVWRQNLWFQLEPNPLWEEITLMLPFVPVGQYFLIDRFHVATECIPEPSTVSLAVLGVFGLIWAGRKRTKSVLRN